MTDLPFVVSFNSLVNCFPTIPIKVPIEMTSDREPHEDISLCEPCASAGGCMYPAEALSSQRQQAEQAQHFH